MRLKTRLVLAATAVTFAIVILLSLLFLGELMRQRVLQTAAANEVLAREVRMMTQRAVTAGLTTEPPKDGSPEALRDAVAEALNSYPALIDTMDAFVRYSPTVQDVSVSDAGGQTLVSTDAPMVGRPTPKRVPFTAVTNANVLTEAREVFGRPQVLDVEMPLELSGRPFLNVHVGVRSTFLAQNFVPWLKGAALLAVVAGFVSIVAAALLALVALGPLEEIRRRLARLTEEAAEANIAPQPLPLPSRRTAFATGVGLGFATVGGLTQGDAVVRVTDTIDQLDRRMRTTEAGYLDLQMNLNQMLDTLRDGVILFTAGRRAVMVSDAVAPFIGLDSADLEGSALVGRTPGEIFSAHTALGRAVLDGFDQERSVAAETVRLEDGREVEFSLDRIDETRVLGRISPGRMGTLLTLRDRGSAIRLEQELEVSRRLAAIGRLTAGVGHEVKNPINAMVVHLELLRTKLAKAGEASSAMRHVDILADEMERLDRVVQTLADFTRPMELHLQALQLDDVVSRVGELTDAEMAEHGVELRLTGDSAQVLGDGELLQQALLNLVLNGMQAMPAGGRLEIRLSRRGNIAVVEVSDEGEGIAPELMPRIFELYFTTKAKGSGIGLAMTYRIVQMHGGSMEVRSEAGQGAVFTILLPLASANAAAPAQDRMNRRLVQNEGLAGRNT